MTINKNFIQKTIDFWSPRYGYRLSEQEALEIIENVSEVFRMLIKWNKNLKKGGNKYEKYSN